MSLPSGVQTPAISKPSLLTRIVNAFTPAKTPLTRKQRAVRTPSLNNLSTPYHHTSINRSFRKRKRDYDNEENFDLNIRTPCIQASGQADIELTNFTVCSMDTSTMFLDSPNSSASPLPRLYPMLESNRSPLSPLCSSPRRSVRIAKRWSMCQQVASPLSAIPTSSPVSLYCTIRV